MAASVVKDSPLLIRRAAVIWSVVFAVLIAAFFVTITVLNNGLYSANGFVNSYLQALTRHDVAEALATPGVALTGNAATTLLAGTALGDLSNIHLVSDTEQGSTHRVTYSYTLNTTHAQTEFVIQHTGQHFGLFPTWRFATSPISILKITPLHDSRFEVNGLAIVSTAGQDKPTAYQVLTPNLYELSHSSTFLTAKKVGVPVVAMGSVVEATIDVQANESFVTQVGKELHSYLDKCATQQVLLPTGCPFGYETGNRIEGTPVWSMSTYPTVAIVPGTVANTWLVPATPAAAHLKVRIRSLFDGSVSTFDKDVPFRVKYLITFDSNGGVKITAQYK
jgi:hypothetical protein